MNSGMNEKRCTIDITFDALRRVPYWQACAEYTIAALQQPRGNTIEEIDSAIDQALKPLGWSIDDLFTYWTEHPEEQ